MFGSARKMMARQSPNQMRGNINQDCTVDLKNKVMLINIKIYVMATFSSFWTCLSNLKFTENLVFPS